MIEFILVAAVFIQISMMIYFVRSRRDKSGSDEVANYLKTDLDKLSSDISMLREGLSEKISDRLDKNQDMMISSLQKQFTQSSKLIAEVTANLTELKESNKHVVSVTDDLKTLQNILQNPKQRGVLGEYYLQSVLENVLPPDRYSMQYKFKSGEIVDAVVFLDKNKILPVDSKFTLENYNRLVEEKDKLAREKLAAAFKADLKLRIDETSKYIKQAENTMDYAFMFIPSEAIYYDLLANKVGSTNVSARDLIEYAFRDKKVIIVSPTTFMAYLQTVIQGLRSLQIEEKAKDIQKRVGELGRHIAVYDDYMQKLGKSLGTTVNHYNNAHKELGKIDKDIVKIADTNPAVEALLVDRPNEQE